MDPGSGTFTSVDPVVRSATNPQTFNGYSYVENNPINAIDPSGMMSLIVTMFDPAATGKNAHLNIQNVSESSDAKPQTGGSGGSGGGEGGGGGGTGGVGPSPTGSAATGGGPSSMPIPGGTVGSAQQSSRSGDIRVELDRLRSEIAALDQQINEAKTNLTQLKQDLAKQLDLMEMTDERLRDLEQPLQRSAEHIQSKIPGQFVSATDQANFARDTFSNRAASIRGEIFREMRHIQSLGATRSERAALVNQIETFGYYGVQ